MSGALEQLYQQIILDHSKLRHGEGLRPAPDGSVPGESHQYNPTCGDEITLRLARNGEQITAISWAGDGCSISMAAASVLTEIVDGGISEADLLSKVDNFRDVLRSRGTIEADEEVLGDAAAFSGVSRYPARVKCAMLSWVAAEEALLASR
ncbi:Fe-S cluster assembly sulfur transfer protein SufU [Arthrobacter castelli]|uniref:Fe-S cluster assembly sulfur transfer protein SufU n=1 Tax=Arthrobacter castelli TaxID=271431 RepID=UPI0003F9D142|nr:SUF system NifU family Fe-S cluster assembly protein [Arthrobacter castelli]